MQHNRYFPIAALVLALAAAACDGATEPQPAMGLLAGSYLAEPGYGTLTLTTTSSGTVTDWIATGARIELNLHANGTTSGTLHVPGGDENGHDMTADLAGTWTVAGTTVHMAHDADTFLRDMPLTVRGKRLEGDRTFGGVRVQLALVRR